MSRRLTSSSRRSRRTRRNPKTWIRKHTRRRSIFPFAFLYAGVYVFAWCKPSSGLRHVFIARVCVRVCMRDERQVVSHRIVDARVRNESVSVGACLRSKTNRGPMRYIRPAALRNEISSQHVAPIAFSKWRERGPSSVSFAARFALACARGLSSRRGALSGERRTKFDPISTWSIGGSPSDGVSVRSVSRSELRL